MTLLFRKRLMSLSLIALVAFSACTDDTDGGRGTGAGGNGLSFLVSTGDTDARTRADGSRADASTRYLDPVELNGKMGGKSLFLQAEVSDGFPGGDQPLTRGTQIDKTNKDTEMQSFAVSAYSDVAGKPDYMYNVKVTEISSVWRPEEIFTWPDSKKLSFYAWHPYGADGLTVSGKDEEGAPVLTYAIPDKVSEQLDVMAAVNVDQSETTAVPLTFKHVLAAIKIVANADLPACTVKSVSLKNVKCRGKYTCPSDGTVADWTLDDVTNSFELPFDNGKVVDGTTETAITDADQTFFMMPQTFDDETARLEIAVEANGYTQTLGAPLKDIVTDGWTAGKTYTIRISSNSFSVELVKERFVASGKDAVSYVKANKDWTAELLTDDDDAQTDMLTFATGQNGVADNSGSSDASKLVFNTKKQSSLNGENKSVTIRFTPKGLGNPVDKTVTFWKALEAPAGSDIFYAVHNADLLTLPQITNRAQCPNGYSLPTEEVAVAISNLDTEAEVAYDKTYPTLDMDKSFIDKHISQAHPTALLPESQFLVAKELEHIKILALGDTSFVNRSNSSQTDRTHLHIKAKYPYLQGGERKETENIHVGTLTQRLIIPDNYMTKGYLTVVAYMHKNADNLLADMLYIDCTAYQNVTTGFENCIKEFDTESYNNISAAFILTSEKITTTDKYINRIEQAENPGAFVDILSYSKCGILRRADPYPYIEVELGVYVGLTTDVPNCVEEENENVRYDALTAKYILEPTANTYYVRKLADDE